MVKALSLGPTSVTSDIGGTQRRPFPEDLNSHAEICKEIWVLQVAWTQTVLDLYVNNQHLELV